MKSIAMLFGSFFLSFSSLGYASTQPPYLFSPSIGVDVSILIDGLNVIISIKRNKKQESQTQLFDTEKKLEIEVKDFNFDGYDDFAVKHLDDGMGIYTIYTIFIYCIEEGHFFRLEPRCGDDFVNLQVFEKERTLTHSYYEENQLKACRSTF